MSHRELKQAIGDFCELKDAVLDSRNPDPRMVVQAQVAGMYAVALALQETLCCQPEEEEDDDE